MKKIYQTKYGKHGNCQSATLATLLGLEIDDVPYFFEGIDLENMTELESSRMFVDNINDFLRTKGYQLIMLGQDSPHTEWVEEISRELKGVKLLVGGMSPRGFMHSVIYLDGKLWHDPHPDGHGVIPYSISFLCPIF